MTKTKNVDVTIPGFAPGFEKPKRGPRKNRDGTQADSFLHGQREADAVEQKQSESAKAIKQAHGYARELEVRIRACRLSTSTPDAIKHDLERVLELCEAVADETNDALKKLDR